MKRIGIVILIITSLFIYPEKVLVRFYNPAQIDTSYDIASMGKNYVDVVIDKDKLSRARGVFSENYEILSVNKNLSGYHSYSEVTAELLTLANSYPATVKLYDIGDSWEKVMTDSYNDSYTAKDIWALKISDNVDFDEDEFNILVMAEHHARELETTEIAMNEIKYLINDYNNGDTFIQNIVNNYQLWFVPMVNPDGKEIVYTEYDTMWRKNNRDNNGNHSYAEDTDGVDPNRNYDWHWGESGVDFNFSSDVYPGTGAFSEYETIAIKDFFGLLRPIGSISYHSYGEMILYPYGYGSDNAPDRYRLYEISYNISRKIPKNSSGYYDPMKSSTLYPASGDSDDYLYGKLGTFSFTIEVGTEFHPPFSEIAGLSQKNYDGLKEFFRNLDTNYINGYIYDNETGLPLTNVNIKILELNDYDMIRTRKNNNNSRYYWNLKNGNYTIIVSKAGYNYKIFNFDMNNDIIEKDFYLTSLNTPNISAYIFPNPSIDKNMMLIIIPDDSGYRENCSIYSASGGLVYKFSEKISTEDITNDSFIISKTFDNGKSLASGIYFAHIKLEKEEKVFEKIIKFAFIH